MSGHKDHTLFRQWVFNCSAGELLGIGLAGGIAVLLNTVMGEPYSPEQKVIMLLVMAGAGAAEGTSVSWFQWRVLRRWYPHLMFFSWWRVTTTAAVLGWLLGMTPSLFMSPGNGTAEQPSWPVVFLLAVAGGMLAGSMFGWFQYLELRKHTARAGWWIMGNSAAWSLALCVIFGGATWPSAVTPVPWILFSALVSGSVAGACLGGVTGWFLKYKIMGRSYWMAH